MHSIKILATIPRRKDISEQQFHDHWRHPHGTLSKKIACLRGYVQSHRIVSPLLPDTQLAYDGITALWYDSLDDALNMGKDPAHRKYNIPDEPLFVDMDGLKFTRSEEHTSELQSLMRTSYAVFCLKKKTRRQITSYLYSTDV